MTRFSICNVSKQNMSFNFTGYCVLHLLSEKHDVLMTKIQRHFCRSVLKISDDMCRGVSKVERALELGSLVLEVSTYVSLI